MKIASVLLLLPLINATAPLITIEDNFVKLLEMIPSKLTGEATKNQDDTNNDFKGGKPKKNVRFDILDSSEESTSGTISVGFKMNVGDKPSVFFANLKGNKSLEEVCLIMNNLSKNPPSIKADGFMEAKSVESNEGTGQNCIYKFPDEIRNIFSERLGKENLKDLSFSVRFTTEYRIENISSCPELKFAFSSDSRGGENFAIEPQLVYYLNTDEMKVEKFFDCGKFLQNYNEDEWVSSSENSIDANNNNEEVGSPKNKNPFVFPKLNQRNNVPSNNSNNKPSNQNIFDIPPNTPYPNHDGNGGNHNPFLPYKLDFNKPQNQNNNVNNLLEGYNPFEDMQPPNNSTGGNEDTNSSKNQTSNRHFFDLFHELSNLNNSGEGADKNNTSSGNQHQNQNGNVNNQSKRQNFSEDTPSQSNSIETNDTIKQNENPQSKGISVGFKMRAGEETSDIFFMDLETTKNDQKKSFEEICSSMSNLDEEFQVIEPVEMIKLRGSEDVKDVTSRCVYQLSQKVIEAISKVSNVKNPNSKFYFDFDPSLESCPKAEFMRNSSNVTNNDLHSLDPKKANFVLIHDDSGNRRNPTTFDCQSFNA